MYIKLSKEPNWVRGGFIGRGSFGTVSLAVNKIDGRVFAVKSLDRSSGLDCQIEALENEIKILRSISSPYVVEYLGDDLTFDSCGSYCRNLHMEYLPGGTIADLGKCSGADEMNLRSYTWCIVSALRYLHAKGIVHCDVKGRNVLLGATPGTAKLADFGSAAEMGASINTPRGSPLWMAPEVIRGEYQGPESDVWSLGCTVIEMFSSKPAWEDRGADTILKIGYSGELPKFPAQLSELGRDFLDKCLRRNPGERWSFDQLLQHPFLIPCDGISNSKWSPRSVLNFSDEFFSETSDKIGTYKSRNGSIFFSNQEEQVTRYSNLDVKGRIEKLVSTRGANWESDGWLEVRNLITRTTQEVEIGTSLVYQNLMRTDQEKAQKSSVYSNFIGNSWRAKLETFSDSSCLPLETNSDHGKSGASRCPAGLSCKKEAIISYSCYQIVVLLFLNLFMYYEYTFMDHIINKQTSTFNISLFVRCLVTCDFVYGFCLQI